jgi:hypothetical protein
MTSTSDTTQTSSEETPTYAGSCHCGAVKFTVRLDLNQPAPGRKTVLSKCNCRICHKTGILGVRASPEGSLELSPESASALTEYTCGQGRIHHFFCSKCGVRIYNNGSYEFQGKEFKIETINVLAVDGKKKDDGTVEEVDWRKIKVGYADGKTDGWMKGTTEEPWEGGVW